MDEGDNLLAAGSAAEYLRARGVIGDGPAEAEALGGGVSNVVIAVTTSAGRVVVKQALPRLRVAREWLAKPERALAEARGLEVALRLAPGAVPRVLDIDAERCAITIESAAQDARPWKEALLRGDARSAVAERLGELLAVWHSDAAAATAFDEWDTFEQLRIDPYYRETAREHPALAPAVLGYAAAMAERRTSFVHGDLSPKNVLVGDQGIWVIDFEVVHRGDPVFDLAFLTTHLALKAIVLPAARERLLGCASAFLAAYARGRAGSPPVDPVYLLGHVGCLMLARVDGKSPAEYLGERERSRVRSIARTLISAPPVSFAGLAAAIEQDT